MKSIDFATEVVSQVTATAEMLEDKVEDILPEYAPSIVAVAIDDGYAAIDVKKGEPLWTPALERHIREHVATFTDSTGTSCRLIVNYI